MLNVKPMASPAGFTTSSVTLSQGANSYQVATHGGSLESCVHRGEVVSVKPSSDFPDDVNAKALYDAVGANGQFVAGDGSEVMLFLCDGMMYVFNDGSPKPGKKLIM